jgi:NhaP-type Na+/H+ or K+/H+ antiporter
MVVSELRNTLQVAPDLNALVYGESVLNDAVAIVLFRTFTGFLTADITNVRRSQRVFTKSLST